MIGSKEDIENLAHKDHARILIISDSHGNYSVLEKIIRQYGKSCDALAFCGDGARDIAQLLSFSKNDDSLKSSIPKVIALAQGNGDPSAYPMENSNYLRIPEKEILTANGQKILIVHGHRQGVDYGLDLLAYEMQEDDCNAAFYGHTHISDEYFKGSYKIINPGSCSRPRGGQPAGFAIATVEKTFIDIAFITVP